MPWHMGKSAECPSSKPWAVIKDDDGKVMGCHMTKADAQKQMAALYVHVPDASNRVEPVDEGPLRDGVEFRSAPLRIFNFKERIIEVIAAPYDENAVVDYRGQMIMERIERGAFDGIEKRDQHVTANREHDYGRTFGLVVDYPKDTAAKGLVAHIYASETILGDETLQLAKDGVLKASVGMVVRPSGQTIKPSGQTLLRRIHQAYLDHIALVPNPAYRGAGVLAVRQESSGVVGSSKIETPRLDAMLAMFPNWPKTY